MCRRPFQAIGRTCHYLSRIVVNWLYLLSFCRSIQSMERGPQALDKLAILKLLW